MISQFTDAYINYFLTLFQLILKQPYKQGVIFITGINIIIQETKTLTKGSNALW